MKKLPAKRRKEALDQRARQYANHAIKYDTRHWERAFFGYQEGYRAAMRDARKAVAADIDVRMPASNMKGVVWDLFPTIRAFLRPLR